MSLSASKQSVIIVSEALLPIKICHKKNWTQYVPKTLEKYAETK